MHAYNRNWDGTERSESGLTGVKEARMLRRALRWQVNREQRFPTRLSQQELELEVDENFGAASLVQKACLATHKLLQSDDARTLGAAAKVVVDMERINQADQIADEKAGSAQEQHVHFHQHGSEVANGTGLHSAERIERLRSKIAERDRVSGTGATSGD